MKRRTWRWRGVRLSMAEPVFLYSMCFYIQDRRAMQAVRKVFGRRRTATVMTAAAIGPIVADRESSDVAATFPGGPSRAARRSRGMNGNYRACARNPQLQ